MFSTGPPKELDDGMKIQAICTNLGIPEEADFYMLVHDLICQLDPERKEGIAFFDSPQNKKYAKRLIGQIGTDRFSVRKMMALAHSLGREWNIKRPLVQLSYMFSDPKYRAQKFSIYEKEILPRIDKYEWDDVSEAMAKEDEMADQETEGLEDTLNT